MDDIRQTALDRFRLYLERRQFSGHSIASYTCDLRLFFAEVAVPLAQASFREVAKRSRFAIYLEDVDAGPVLKSARSIASPMALYPASLGCR